MKVHKPFKIVLPAGFSSSLEEYLKKHPPGFSYQVEYFYLIMQHLIEKEMQQKDKTENDKFVSLNKTKLNNLIHSKIDRYIKKLEKGEFIISDRKFIKGKKEIHYKTSDKLTGFEIVEIPPGTKAFDKLYRKFKNRKAHFNRLNGYQKTMKDEIMNLEIDFEGAYNWIKQEGNPRKKYYYMNSLIMLQDKRMRYFKRSKTNGRLDTNLTSLKKELRQFIKGDFVSIDLKNSQPFFLSQLIHTIPNLPPYSTTCGNIGGLGIKKTFGVRPFQKISKIHQKMKKQKMVNLSAFAKEVREGNFYEYFMERYPGDIERDEVKKIMFHVLYSRNPYYNFKIRKWIAQFNKEKKIFKSLFPFIFEVIKALKEKKHNKLAICMQKIESFIFIDCIAQELVKAGIVPLTIHDSVIVPKHQVKEAMRIVKRVFNEQVGETPSFSIEALKPNRLGQKQPVTNFIDNNIISQLRDVNRPLFIRA